MKRESWSPRGGAAVFAALRREDVGDGEVVAPDSGEVPRVVFGLGGVCVEPEDAHERHFGRLGVSTPAHRVISLQAFERAPHPS